MTYISYVPRICLQVTKNKGSSVLFFVQIFEIYYLYFFLSSYGIYLLCSTNLIISYKNLALLFVLGGWLEEKDRSNQISI